MSENLCVRCGRPTPDGYCCSGCAYRAGDQLHDTADMAPAARDIAHRTSRRGGGGGSGKPGSSLPLDLGATQRLDAVQNTLGTIARGIADARGIELPDARRGEPIAVIALWTAGHVEWLRHALDGAEPYALRAFDEIEACMRLVRGLARGPAEQKYLGPCGAVLAASATPCPGDCFCRSGPRTALSEACVACSCLTACHPTVDTGAEGQICDGDVYAHGGSKRGRCRACGAEVATAEREAWLDGEVREYAFEARHIAEAHRINVKTIRTWANRGALRSYFVTDAGIVAEWTEPAEGEERGPRVHYVGDVLDLAAADAARRATEQAKRARRAAAKAAETEDAA